MCVVKSAIVGGRGGSMFLSIFQLCGPEGLPYVTNVADGLASCGADANRRQSSDCVRARSSSLTVGKT